MPIPPYHGVFRYDFRVRYLIYWHVHSHQKQRRYWPNDLIAIILTDKLQKFQFRWVRMTCDLFFVILGYILGGTVGIGTVIAAFLTGPLVQFWLPKSEFLIKQVLKE